RTDARADALLVGALAAHLWTRGKDIPTRVLIPAAWCASALVAVCLFRFEWTDSFLYYGGFTGIAASGSGFLRAVVEGSAPPCPTVTFGPLRAVGRMSYGLCLWSPLAFAVAAQHMHGVPTVVRVGSGFAMAAAATVGSWFFVERPVLRWKDRLSSP